MHDDGARGSGGGPGVLISALAWRARREGLRYLLVGFVPFAVALGLTVVPATLGGPVNGAGTFARFASSYRAHAGGSGLVSCCSSSRASSPCAARSPSVSWCAT